MAEVVHALSNGVSEAVISAVAGGGAASLPLLNIESKPCVTLRCRSRGAWGNALRAEVRALTNTSGAIVRVSLRLMRNGNTEESFQDLQVRPGAPDDLFETINQQSRLVVAVDPGFDRRLPRGKLMHSTTTAHRSMSRRREEGGARNHAVVAGVGIQSSGLSARLAVANNQVNVQVFQAGLPGRIRSTVS